MFDKEHIYIDKRNNQIMIFVEYSSSFDTYFFMRIKDGFILPFFEEEIKNIIEY